MVAVHDLGHPRTKVSDLNANMRLPISDQLSVAT